MKLQLYGIDDLLMAFSGKAIECAREKEQGFPEGEVAKRYDAIWKEIVMRSETPPAWRDDSFVAQAWLEMQGVMQDDLLNDTQKQEFFKSICSGVLANPPSPIAGEPSPVKEA